MVVRVFNSAYCIHSLQSFDINSTDDRCGTSPFNLAVKFQAQVTSHQYKCLKCKNVNDMPCSPTPQNESSTEGTNRYGARGCEAAFLHPTATQALFPVVLCQLYYKRQCPGLPFLCPILVVPFDRAASTLRYENVLDGLSR